MAKYKQYIICGVILLAAVLAAYIFGIVFYVKYFGELLNNGTFDAGLLLKFILFFIFGTLFGAGGLFLVIFFSIKGKKLDKQNALNKKQD